MPIILALIMSASCFAEYRAFQLLITNAETQSTRTVISTLDHIQYPQYYPLEPNETAAIQETWMCYHNGSHFQDICPNPQPKE